MPSTRATSPPSWAAAASCPTRATRATRPPRWEGCCACRGVARCTCASAPAGTCSRASLPSLLPPSACTMRPSLCSTTHSAGPRAARRNQHPDSGLCRRHCHRRHAAHRRRPRAAGDGLAPAAAGERVGRLAKAAWDAYRQGIHRKHQPCLSRAAFVHLYLTCRPLSGPHRLPLAPPPGARRGDPGGPQGDGGAGARARGSLHALPLLGAQPQAPAGRPGGGRQACRHLVRGQVDQPSPAAWPAWWPSGPQATVCDWPPAGGAALSLSRQLAAPVFLLHIASFDQPVCLLAAPRCQLLVFMPHFSGSPYPSSIGFSNCSPVTPYCSSCPGPAQHGVLPYP